MAFVQGSGVAGCLPGSTRGAAMCRMAAEPEPKVSRRALVFGAGVSALGLLVAPVLAKDAKDAPKKPDLSLEDLKKLEAKLKYDEELLENPEQAMKMKTNIKKPRVTPSYIVEEQNQVLKRKEKYQKEVKKELEADAELAKKFSKMAK